MRKTLLLAVLTLTLTAGTSRAGDDDLFSKVRLDSTSNSAGKSAEPAPTQPRGRSVSGVNTLEAVLLAAGYSARLDDNDAVIITVSRSDWTADVSLTLLDGGRQLRMAMRLTEPDTNTVLAPKTLRGMLEANLSNTAASFAISAESQAIELVKTISNAGLSSEQMTADLDAMADMADATSDVWKTKGIRLRKADTQTISTESTSTPRATSTPSTTVVAATLSLDGKWIATPNTNEAFALQLDAAGTFRLVHVKGTASTRSKGNFTLSDGTLTLTGDDGTTITGTVAKQSDSFTLVISGAAGKSVTLTFKASA